MSYVIDVQPASGYLVHYIIGADFDIGTLQNYLFHL